MELRLGRTSFVAGVGVVDVVVEAAAVLPVPSTEDAAAGRRRLRSPLCRRFVVEAGDSAPDGDSEEDDDDDDNNNMRRTRRVHVRGEDDKPDANKKIWLLPLCCGCGLKAKYNIRATRML